MKRQDAIEEIKRELPARIWQRDKSRGRHAGYVCPICGSGSGPHGTGISTKDGLHYTCWAAAGAADCFTSADVIEVVGLQYGLNDFNEQLKKCCELYGLNYEDLEADTISSTTSKPVVEPAAAEPKEEPKEDFLQFFVECAEHINDTDYMQKRGISERILKAFNIGYCKCWQHPTALKEYANGERDKRPFMSKRIIIPTSPHSYLARAVDENEKVQKQKAGPSCLFNAGILSRTTGYVFITEGEIDAMSFYEVGLKAVALGSTKNYLKLVDLLQNGGTAATLLLALDNDKDGEETAHKLKAKLNEIGVNSFIVNCYGTHKDGNEALVADREAFLTGCNNAIKTVDEAPSEEEQEREAYKQAHGVQYLRESFRLERELNATRPVISTGLQLLDDILNGGLQKGLYFIGGISSIGKTTFCMQIADNVAAAGTDVLVFALEMSKHELIAKSVSRYTYIEDLNRHQTSQHAKTTNAILYGQNRDRYTKEEKDLIEAATSVYFDQIAPCLYIHEGVGNIGVEQIKTAVETHIKITGNKPVVLVDYLQILAPYEVRATDKQNIDKAVLELKRISRDEEIPIIAISSFNRESYTSAVTMASFKESGAVEYTSDVLIGLQYAGMDREANESEDAYKKRIVFLRELEAQKGNAGKAQRIQVKILKNRNGRKGSVELNFIPAFNYVYEDDPFKKVNTPQPQPKAYRI